MLDWGFPTLVQLISQVENVLNQINTISHVSSALKSFFDQPFQYAVPQFLDNI